MRFSSRYLVKNKSSFFLSNNVNFVKSSSDFLVINLLFHKNYKRNNPPIYLLKKSFLNVMFWSVKNKKSLFGLSKEIVSEYSFIILKFFVNWFLKLNLYKKAQLWTWFQFFLNVLETLFYDISASMRTTVHRKPFNFLKRFLVDNSGTSELNVVYGDDGPKDVALVDKVGGTVDEMSDISLPMISNPFFFKWTSFIISSNLDSSLFFYNQKSQNVQKLNKDRLVYLAKKMSIWFDGFSIKKAEAIKNVKSRRGGAFVRLSGVGYKYRVFWWKRKFVQFLHNSKIRRNAFLDLHKKLSFKFIKKPWIVGKRWRRLRRRLKSRISLYGMVKLNKNRLGKYAKKHLINRRSFFVPIKQIFSGGIKKKGNAFVNSRLKKLRKNKLKFKSIIRDNKYSGGRLKEYNMCVVFLRHLSKFNFNLDKRDFNFLFLMYRKFILMQRKVKRKESFFRSYVKLPVYLKRVGRMFHLSTYFAFRQSDILHDKERTHLFRLFPKKMRNYRFHNFVTKSYFLKNYRRKMSRRRKDKAGNLINKNNVMLYDFVDELFYNRWHFLYRMNFFDMVVGFNYGPSLLSYITYSHKKFSLNSNVIRVRYVLGKNAFVLSVGKFSRGYSYQFSFKEVFALINYFKYVYLLQVMKWRKDLLFTERFKKFPFFFNNFCFMFKDKDTTQVSFFWLNYIALYMQSGVMGLQKSNRFFFNYCLGLLSLRFFNFSEIVSSINIFNMVKITSRFFWRKRCVIDHKKKYFNLIGGGWKGKAKFITTLRNVGVSFKGYRFKRFFTRAMFFEISADVNLRNKFPSWSYFFTWPDIDSEVQVQKRVKGSKRLSRFKQGLNINMRYALPFYIYKYYLFKYKSISRSRRRFKYRHPFLEYRIKRRFLRGMLRQDRFELIYNRLWVEIKKTLSRRIESKGKGFGALMDVNKGTWDVFDNLSFTNNSSLADHYTFKSFIASSAGRRLLRNSNILGSALVKTIRYTFDIAWGTRWPTWNTFNFIYRKPRASLWRNFKFLMDFGFFRFLGRSSRNKEFKKKAFIFSLKKIQRLSEYLSSVSRHTGNLGNNKSRIKGFNWWDSKFWRYFARLGVKFEKKQEKDVKLLRLYRQFPGYVIAWRKSKILRYYLPSKVIAGLDDEEVDASGFYDEFYENYDYNNFDWLHLRKRLPKFQRYFKIFKYLFKLVKRTKWKSVRFSRRLERVNKRYKRKKGRFFFKTGKRLKSIFFSDSGFLNLSSVKKKFWFGPQLLSNLYFSFNLKMLHKFTRKLNGTHFYKLSAIYSKVFKRSDLYLDKTINNNKEMKELLDIKGESIDKLPELIRNVNKRQFYFLFLVKVSLFRLSGIVYSFLSLVNFFNKFKSKLIKNNTLFFQLMWHGVFFSTKRFNVHWLSLVWDMFSNNLFLSNADDRVISLKKVNSLPYSGISAVDHKHKFFKSEKKKPRCSNYTCFKEFVNLGSSENSIVDNVFYILAYNHKFLDFFYLHFFKVVVGNFLWDLSSGNYVNSTGEFFFSIADVPGISPVVIGDGFQNFKSTGGICADLLNFYEDVKFLNLFESEAGFLTNVFTFVGDLLKNFYTTPVYLISRTIFGVFFFFNIFQKVDMSFFFKSVLVSKGSNLVVSNSELRDLFSFRLNDFKQFHDILLNYCMSVKLFDLNWRFNGENFFINLANNMKFQVKDMFKDKLELFKNDRVKFLSDINYNFVDKFWTFVSVSNQAYNNIVNIKRYSSLKIHLSVTSGNIFAIFTDKRWPSSMFYQWTIGQKDPSKYRTRRARGSEAALLDFASYLDLFMDTVLRTYTMRELEIVYASFRSRFWRRRVSKFIRSFFEFFSLTLQKLKVWPYILKIVFKRVVFYPFNGTKMPKMART